MKPMYKCEICGSIYETEEACKKCEDRGVPDISSIPLYVITQQDNLTFADAKIELYSNPGHLYSVLLWACRGNGAGDSLGSELCGAGGLYDKNKGHLSNYHKVTNLETPEFKRMVQYLVDNDLPVRYWDGKEIIEYKHDFLKTPERVVEVEDIEDVVEEPKPKYITYKCRYGMYLHNKGVVSSIGVTTGPDSLIRAIKNANINAILLSITDTDGTVYTVREHEEDRNGSFGYYWVHSVTGEVLYDEYSDRDVYPPKEEVKSVKSALENISTAFQTITEVVKQHSFPEVMIEKYKNDAEFGQDERELPIEILDTYGVGVTFTTNGVEYTTFIHKRNEGDPREVYLKTRSWVGISPGAIHSYGKFSVYDPTLRYIEDDKIQTSSIGGAFKKPDECKSFNIEVMRLLTQEEITEDPQRWEGYDAGCSTNCFYTTEEVIEKAKEIFAKRFVGNWKLIIE